MQLTAIRSGDQHLVEAFAIGAEEWAAMMGDPVGSYVLPCGAPTLPQRDTTGLQFFATEHEMRASRPTHEQLTILRIAGDCATHVRSLGLGCDLDADLASFGVLDAESCLIGTGNGRQIAFILRSEFLALDEYEARVLAFDRAGIKCVWLVRSLRQYRLLQSATYYSLVRSGGVPDNLIDEGVDPCLPWLCALPLLPCDDHGRTANMMAVSLPTKQGGHRRLLLPDFVAGVLGGQLCFSRQQWKWRAG